MYNLKNKSLIVTGGSGGMGREAARLAAKAGARVTVADLGVEGGEETIRLIEADGGIAQFVRTDISDEAEVEALVKAAVARYDRLDGAFNNAGIPQINVPLHEIPTEIFRRSLNVNVMGTFFCMKYEIAAMLKTGGGAIVNTSSGAGVVGYMLGAEYVSSKHAVLGLTRTGALDYAKQNIRVNAILPGATLSPMLTTAIKTMPEVEQFLINATPMGRLAQPAEIAATAVWLLSDHASFVTGACLSVDGGFTTQ
jgi:2,5-dichloro-2,5-cyclohexadiene-1,4-diol dehydrogenase 1